MDALSAFGINWKLLAIQAVNFSIVLLVLWRFLYRPLFAMLDKRQKTIEKGLEDAKAASVARADVAAEKDDILLSAREEGGKIVERLRKEGVDAERRMLREAQEKSAALLAESRTKAEDERVHILRESEKEVAKMAILAAEKIMREPRRTATNK